jgi:flavodoxin
MTSHPLQNAFSLNWLRLMAVAYEMKFFISVFGTFGNGDFEFDNKNVKF